MSAWLVARGNKKEIDVIIYQDGAVNPVEIKTSLPIYTLSFEEGVLVKIIDTETPAFATYKGGEIDFVGQSGKIDTIPLYILERYSFE